MRNDLVSSVRRLLTQVCCCCCCYCCWLWWWWLVVSAPLHSYLTYRIEDNGRRTECAPSRSTFFRPNDLLCSTTGPFPSLPFPKAKKSEKKTTKPTTILQHKPHRKFEHRRPRSAPWRQRCEGRPPAAPAGRASTAAFRRCSTWAAAAAERRRRQSLRPRAEQAQGRPWARRRPSRWGPAVQVGGGSGGGMTEGTSRC